MGVADRGKVPVVADNGLLDICRRREIAAGRIDIEDHRRSAVLGGVIQRALHKLRLAWPDHAVDIDHIDLWLAGGVCGWRGECAHCHRYKGQYEPVVSS